MKIIYTYKIRNLKDFLFFIWELPQNLLGMLLIITVKAWYSVAWDDCYFSNRIKGVYSLGSFIVLSVRYYDNVSIIKCAKNYQDLSKKTGWLYLLILLFRKRKY